MFYITKDGRHGVDIIQNGSGFLAFAQMPDGRGGLCYWFTVGEYKTLKNALRYSARALKRSGYELVIESDAGSTCE